MSDSPGEIDAHPPDGDIAAFAATDEDSHATPLGRSRATDLAQ